MKPKILSFDIETRPLQGYFWSIWKQNIGLNQINEGWSVLTWAAKFLDEDEVRWDSAHRNSERDMLANIRDLLDETDIAVAHNGVRFDTPKLNARFLKYGIDPPSPYQTVDTLLTAKKQFAFTSNRLDSIANELGIGRKAETGGFALWEACCNGDPEAFEKMVEYNIQDIYLLEEVYLRLRPWIRNHPNVGNLVDREYSCPKCGSDDVHRRGYTHTSVGKYQRYQCNSCGGWSRGRFTERSSEDSRGLLVNA